MASLYQAALNRARQSGQAGTVVPYGGGSRINYKFVPYGDTGGGGAGGVSLLEAFQKREAEARATNLAAEKEIRGTYQGLINQDYGAFREANLADIERGKRQAIGAGQQQLISSGLYGTTTAAALPIQAENVAAGQRVKLEDLIQQRRNEAKLGLAGFVERIERPYPDFSALMQAYAAQASA